MGDLSIPNDGSLLRARNCLQRSILVVVLMAVAPCLARANEASPVGDPNSSRVSNSIEEATKPEVSAPREGATKTSKESEVAQPVKDGDDVRVRAGFSAAGGYSYFDGLHGFLVVAPFSFRTGVQINDYFGVIVEWYPTIIGADQGERRKGGLVFQVPALAMLTLGDFFDVGAGISLDVIGEGGEDLGGSRSRGSAAFGLGSKVAFSFGGSTEGGGFGTDDNGRDGFNVSVNPHVMFAFDKTVFTLTCGLGYEWF
jgi:hypothetical protein